MIYKCVDVIPCTVVKGNTLTFYISVIHFFLIHVRGSDKEFIILFVLIKFCFSYFYKIRNNVFKQLTCIIWIFKENKTQLHNILKCTLTMFACPYHLPHFFYMNAHVWVDQHHHFQAESIINARFLNDRQCDFRS